MRIVNNKYVQLFSAFIIYSFVGVLSKIAALSGFGFKFYFYVGLQFVFLAAYALIWQQILKKFSLIAAMACKGIVVILSLVWAIVFFQESISLNNVLGALLIVLGIYIVSTGEENDAQ